jgi:hypothetical protein
VFAYVGLIKNLEDLNSNAKKSQKNVAEGCDRTKHGLSQPRPAHGRPVLISGNDIKILFFKVDFTGKHVKSVSTRQKWRVAQVNINFRRDKKQYFYIVSGDKYLTESDEEEDDGGISVTRTQS